MLTNFGKLISWIRLDEEEQFIKDTKEDFKNSVEPFQAQKSFIVHVWGELESWDKTLKKGRFKDG